MPYSEALFRADCDRDIQAMMQSAYAPSNGDDLRQERFDELERAYDCGQLSLHDLFNLVLDLGEEVRRAKTNPPNGGIKSERP